MGRKISIPGKDGAFSAYLAEPEGSAPGPTVVVAQEIFGVNAVMRETCDWLASEGYWAVCPDLFWRIKPGIDITDQTEAEWAQAFDLYKAFNVDTGIDDLGATIAHARGMGATSIGTVGYCLGGLLAFLTACRTSTDAAVGYYGVGIDGFLAEAPKIKSPVMLHIAEEDGFVNKDSQASVKAALQGPLYEIFSYPGRDHAFARQGGKNYHATDAATANGRTLAFFRKYLR
jgi:carboxymethylenebutenolidase